ncbi:DUF421 domain-containing protein [Paenibacillus alkalitolerans]|uniref:DUF421 domain-containing protein n=1 Tax=Paenibacillus alkalitolerans TaxID=2799335 RepID=UPI0018F6F243|nr:DUF421 domain-containing protein [Paenibacillus alkalitolerans]
METIKDILIIYGRIITIFPLVLIIALFMGRRSIGELPVFDFLIIVSLGSIVGADIADPRIEHIPTAFAVAGVGLLQKSVSTLVVKNRRFGKWVTFEPIVVVKDGKIIVNNLKKVKYSIDNILQMLRENDVFDIAAVDTAVLEASGKLTVHKKTEKAAVTAEDLGITKTESGISYAVIMEGRIEQGTVNELNLDEVWILNQISEKGLQLKDIFLATINDKREMNITIQNQNISPRPLHH